MPPTYDGPVRAHPPATARTRAAALAALLAVLATTGLLLAGPAHAATRTVTLTSSGPVPSRLVLGPGDRVRFTNADNVQHRVTAARGWKFDSGALAPGATSGLTPVLTRPARYDYTDTRSLLLTVATFDGALVVPAPAPSPSATRSPSPRPAPTTPGPAPSATAPGPVLPTGAPTPAPFPTAVPTYSPPAVVAPTTLPSAAPDIRYGDPQALVQSSPHRYGLPALLGLVGIVGVASLLLRLLLSMAPGSRRTDA
jgi:plastocyanin